MYIFVRAWLGTYFRCQYTLSNVLSDWLLAIYPPTHPHGLTHISHRQFPSIFQILFFIDGHTHEVVCTIVCAIGHGIGAYHHLHVPFFVQFPHRGTSQFCDLGVVMCEGMR